LKTLYPRKVGGDRRDFSYQSVSFRRRSKSEDLCPCLQLASEPAQREVTHEGEGFPSGIPLFLLAVHVNGKEKNVQETAEVFREALTECDPGAGTYRFGYARSAIPRGCPE
jgi:hypothetical protein